MEKIEKKKILYIIGGVILLGVIIYAVFVNLKKSGNDQNIPANSEPVSSGEPTGNTPGGTASKPASGTSKPAARSYLDALKIYRTSGYYFQFSGCSGKPGSLTLKKGVEFMLDNRDGVNHKIVVEGGQTFSIGAYGFAIATAPSAIGTHHITCDGGGSASILVQK
ncbi:MAG TPA: hypothetical protein VLK22_04030 [Candidatus Udaeobacter sp.]|nr:hypothetical protein [Candidatus Udaeobacter sp.]